MPLPARPTRQLQAGLRGRCADDFPEGPAPPPFRRETAHTHCIKKGCKHGDKCRRGCPNTEYHASGGPRRTEVSCRVPSGGQGNRA
eukprot:2295323-Pyramimonas_sp.AAC.1